MSPREPTGTLPHERTPIEKLDDAIGVDRQITLSRDELKLALKDALKEWLDEKFLTLGRWTAAGIGAAIVAGMVWFILSSQGWHK